MILYLGTASFVNVSLFTEPKEKAPLIKHFGPMYIDFDEYPPYSSRISEFLKKMLMKIFGVIMIIHILQGESKFVHGLMRKVG